MKNKGVLKTFMRLLKFMFSQYKVAFILVIIFSFILASGDIVSSLFIRVLLDKYIVPYLGVGDVVMNDVVLYLLKTSVLLFITFLSALFVSETFAVVCEKVLYTLRKKCFDKAENAPVSFFDSTSYGRVMSVFTNDMDTISDVIIGTIPDFMRLGLSSLMIFIAMMVTSVRLSAVVCVYIVIILCVMTLLSKRSIYYFRQNQESLSAMNGFIEESISSEKIIKTFSYEDRSIKAFEKFNEDLAFNSAKAHKYSNIYMPVMGNISNIAYVILAFIGIFVSINGKSSLSVGSIIMFLMLMKSFTSSFSSLSSQIGTIMRSASGAERIFRFLEVEDDIDEGTIEEFKNVKGDIEFRNVSFSYDEKKKILDNVSFHIKSGENVSFVGATGEGKTTIINLLERFYEPDSGEILVDGVNISDIKKNALRSEIALVSQDIHLFSGTIKDNIKYSSPSASDERVYNATKMSGADSFISLLQNGYDTHINGLDAGLSEGQKQLLSISRAFLKNAPIMILDEATSSVDSNSEEKIQKALKDLVKDKTSITIAHRLSTVKNSDRIYVLKGGKIKESGSHDELLEQKGLYYDLYNGIVELE